MLVIIALPRKPVDPSCHKYSVDLEDDATALTIKADLHCPCQKRIAFDLQCCHEFCLTSWSLDFIFWSCRWYNDNAFDLEAPGEVPNFNGAADATAHFNAVANWHIRDGNEDGDKDANKGGLPTVEESNDKAGNTGVFPQVGNGLDGDDDSECDDIPLASLGGPTHSSLTEKFQFLLHVVQNSRSMKQSLDVTLDTMIHQAWHMLFFPQPHLPKVAWKGVTEGFLGQV